MRSDVAYGAFLSGGIDSSAIVGLMAEVSTQPVSTFSVTFAEQELDESPWSRAIAKRFQTDHHEIRLTPADFLAQVPAGLAAMDHPSADGLNTFVVSGATRGAGVKVALSGLGGDELFAGYPVFARSAQLARLNWLAAWPKGLRRWAGKAYTSLKPSMTARKQAEILAGHYFDVAHTYPVSRQMFLRSDLQRMLTSDVPLRNDLFSWLVKELAPGKKAFGLPFLSQVSLAEMRSYMGHTLLRDADQFSMAHALEVRVPFLDHRLVAAALAAPDSDKFPSSPKRLLVESLDGLLPDDVVNRPKMGFVLPWEAWMRGELKGVCEAGLQSLKDRAWVQSDAIVDMERSFMAGESQWSWSRVWSLVVLGEYLERHGLE
jgi:asparagine synthase (glutamine-hydrolysing)